MKRFALVRNNSVSNIATWDGTSEWTPPNVELIDTTDIDCFIGDPKPPVLNKQGLYWFDATDPSTMTLAGSRINEWRDKLGSGVKFVTSSPGTSWNPSFDPALNKGKGGINATGGATRKFLDSSAPFPLNWTTGWTILAVVKRTSRSGFYFAQDKDHGMVLGTGFCERAGIGTGTTASQGILANTPAVFGTVFSGNGGTYGYRFIVDENVYGQTEGSVITGYSGPFGKLAIGSVGGAIDGGRGEIAGFFFYNRALTSDEIANQVKWARCYYRIGSLPATTWNIVIDGNSLAMGFGAKFTNAMYDGALAANGSPTQSDIKVVSWSGSTTEQLRSRAVSTVDSLYESRISPSRRICMFWEGTNDIVLNGTSLTSQQLFDRIKNYCLARKTKGWKVIVGTILPRTTAYADFEVKRIEVNQKIRSAKAAGEAWIDAIADVGADRVIGLQGANLNTTYYGDGVHLTEAGYAAAAPFFRDAINEVSGVRPG